MSLIDVCDISKEFKIYKYQKGIVKAVKSLFYREYEIKKAVENISFQIDKGELVGYIGPNGAGKSTTIKILSGILLPTKGRVMVNGLIPYENRKKNAMRIGVVFGQRSQLNWDLPMGETFALYKKMYKIEPNRFKKNVEFYIELLDMHEFLNRPVRQLSLGEKMRANLAVALLHDPDILYLDEPTIGLDVVVKNKIRRFIKEVNKEKKVTVILTTHDMNDIEQICNRLIMIDRGHILYDGSLHEFKQYHGKQYIIQVDFLQNNIDVEKYGFVLMKDEGSRKSLLFDKSRTSIAEAVRLITEQYDIVDLSIKETDIENIVRRFYENKNDTGWVL